MKIAIFGAGLIGDRRGSQKGNHEIVGIYDPVTERSEALAEKLGAPVFYSEEAALSSDADILILATTNHSLHPLAVKGLQRGKHLLLEKPGGIRVAELEEIHSLSLEKRLGVKVGFNLRFHPGIRRAKQMLDEGALGELMFLRARYGHGGRLHMEREWRFQPEFSGGGELLDQGVHILDLIHWILGPLPLQSSFVTRSFWRSEVDDNAVLTVADGRSWATFHVSCSEWKNTFSMEIYGKTGKLLLDGLGGSYGAESLTFYRMLPEMGPPEVFRESFSASDDSWFLDLDNLCKHIERGEPLLGDLPSAIYALQQVRVAYRTNGFLHLPASN